MSTTYTFNGDSFSEIDRDGSILNNPDQVGAEPYEWFSASNWRIGDLRAKMVHNSSMGIKVKHHVVDTSTLGDYKRVKKDFDGQEATFHILTLVGNDPVDEVELQIVMVDNPVPPGHRSTVQLNQIGLIYSCKLSYLRIFNSTGPWTGMLQGDAQNTYYQEWAGCFLRGVSNSNHINHSVVNGNQPTF